MQGNAVAKTDGTHKRKGLRLWGRADNWTGLLREDIAYQQFGNQCEESFDIFRGRQIVCLPVRDLRSTRTFPSCSVRCRAAG